MVSEKMYEEWQRVVKELNDHSTHKESTSLKEKFPKIILDKLKKCKVDISQFDEISDQQKVDWDYNLIFPDIERSNTDPILGNTIPKEKVSVNPLMFLSRTLYDEWYNKSYNEIINTLPNDTK